jgi:hypothetical protein
MIIRYAFRLTERKAKVPAEVRHRRPRADIREELLKSALVEFGAKGFDGASTRAIAARIQAHQPQINYHFESKGSPVEGRGGPPLWVAGQGAVGSRSVACRTRARKPASPAAAATRAPKIT